MYTNTDIIEKVLASKGLTIYDVYMKMGRNRWIYTSRETNNWTYSLLARMSQVAGVDLTPYANSENGNKGE